MNKIYELKPGDEGAVIEALVNRVVVGKTNGANRSTYLSITLQDKTGTIDAKLWNANPEQVEKIKAGCVVQVMGDVIRYNEDRQMKIIKIKITSSDAKEQVKFLKSAPESGQSLIDEITQYIERIDNLKLNQLVKTIFNRYVDKLSIYPAASKNHHEYVSGLAFHTCSMLRIADAICKLYPSLNKDLLFAGITLHDLGKTVELSGPVVPEYTVEGKLLGHISISQAIIKETADEMHIEGEEVVLLQHMILSHHGKNEYGSPVLPQIKEAEVLYLIDNMDARINMLEKALESVEPGSFSKRVFPLENRAFYKPKIDEID
ncbi:OB-fold nucleic acid binding domain-containing protein [Thomasclavelia sp.]|uniref:OB-fold nucleic acid binding domain-containing protein n=1 Tax=Thomasclavelia sp. TaxID=3025757 RepID=UPI0025CF6F95|nr:OB-fold nucleic acid binding domain-containing protein [Thomasclavelia sp.]